MSMIPALLLAASALSQSSPFRLNQVGYASDGPKLAVLLDEAVWNLRWMLTMQDPDDGGVYHRLSTANFPGDNTMPVTDRSPRYVVRKSTAAALDLAATAAKATRVLRVQSPALAKTNVPDTFRRLLPSPMWMPPAATHPTNRPSTRTRP